MIPSVACDRGDRYGRVYRAGQANFGEMVMSSIGGIQGGGAAQAAATQQKVGTAVLQKTQENARAQGKAALSLIEDVGGNASNDGDGDSDDGHVNVVA
jgi:hypothetical protein